MSAMQPIQLASAVLLAIGCLFIGLSQERKRKGIADAFFITTIFIVFLTFWRAFQGPFHLM